MCCQNLKTENEWRGLEPSWEQFWGNPFASARDFCIIDGLIFGKKVFLLRNQDLIDRDELYLLWLPKLLPELAFHQIFMKTLQSQGGSVFPESPMINHSAERRRRLPDGCWCDALELRIFCRPKSSRLRWFQSLPIALPAKRLPLLARPNCLRPVWNDDKLSKQCHQQWWVIVSSQFSISQIAGKNGQISNDHHFGTMIVCKKS